MSRVTMTPSTLSTVSTGASLLSFPIFNGFRRIVAALDSAQPLPKPVANAKRRTLMLRITIHDRAPMTSFVLEGKLVGPWVRELRQCWQDAVADDPATPMLVDLAAVTFVDYDGRALLKQMRIRASGHRHTSHRHIVASQPGNQTRRDRFRCVKRCERRR